MRAFKCSRTYHVILSLRHSTAWRKNIVLPSLLDMVSARHLRPSVRVMRKHPNEVKESQYDQAPKG